LIRQIPNKALNTKNYPGINKPLAILWLFLLFCFLPAATKAQFAGEYQQADSTFLSNHSPHRATFLSALVPGLGQIYNQKYWKVPIIYAGFGGMIYYVNYNNFVYEKYKNAYNIKIRIADGETGLIDPFPGAGKDYMQRLKDSRRRYRDLMYISIGILYVMQIIDADVDAHLFYFDMSEDLSLKIEPVVSPVEPMFIGEGSTASLGLRCAIRF